MEPKLHHIHDWFDGLSCAPTALAAISGKSLTDIGVLLQQAANTHGRNISDRLLETYDLSDTLLAIKLMGSFWLAAEEFDRRPFHERPTIDEWGTRDRSSGIKLVFCDDGGTDGHIFAAQEGNIVDTYTRGNCIPFEAVPASYRKFRVKLTFLILVPAPSGQTKHPIENDIP
jgi:hypothetical protein